MNEEQRRRVGEYVRAQRAHKFQTVDAARIAAGISRGAWDAVEQGKKARDFTYGAVEKALGVPPGRLQDVARGGPELMEAFIEGDAIYADLMEWAAGLRPGIAFEPPPTSALAFWTTEQLLEMLAIREGGHRETVRWHVERYEKLKARLDAIQDEPGSLDVKLDPTDRQALEDRTRTREQEATRTRHASTEAADGREPTEERGTAG